MKNLTLILAVLLAFYSCQKDDDKKEEKRVTFVKKIAIDDNFSDTVEDIYFTDNTLYFVGKTIDAPDKKAFVGAIESSGTIRFVKNEFATTLENLSRIVVLKDGTMLVLGNESPGSDHALYRMDGQGELISAGASIPVAEASGLDTGDYDFFLDKMLLTSSESLLFAYHAEPSGTNDLCVVFRTDINLQFQKSLTFSGDIIEIGLMPGGKMVVVDKDSDGYYVPDTIFIYDNNMDLIARKPFYFPSDYIVVSDLDHDFFYVISDQRVNKFDSELNEIYQGTTWEILMASNKNAVISNDGGLVFYARGGVYNRDKMLVKCNGTNGGKEWQTSDDMIIPSLFTQLPSGHFMGLSAVTHDSSGADTDIVAIKVTSSGKKK